MDDHLIGYKHIAANRSNAGFLAMFSTYLNDERRTIGLRWKGVQVEVWLYSQLCVEGNLDFKSVVPTKHRFLRFKLLGN